MFVADLDLKDIEPIANLLSNEFYFDTEMAKDAVRRKSSFNIISKEELFKIDIFVQGYDESSNMEMERRILYRFADNEDSIFVCSPEDIIAHKLYWYKLGDEISDRQWDDVINVIKVNLGKLDLDYLKNICRKRGVLDLLEKALR